MLISPSAVIVKFILFLQSCFYYWCNQNISDSNRRGWQDSPVPLPALGGRHPYRGFLRLTKAQSISLNFDSILLSGLLGILSVCFSPDRPTACGHRMAHRKWRDIKLQPGTAGPGNMLGSCLVSFHILWANLCPQAVDLNEQSNVNWINWAY